MGTLTFRPYQPGDESGIIELYRAVFNLEIPLSSWQWMYQIVPDVDAIVVVAENQTGIIGHYAVQSRPFWLHGQSCLAGLAVGTMIHPDARNVTTLVDMAHLAYDLCREKGLQFLYAFPNDTAWKVRQLLLGWQALPQIIEWVGEVKRWEIPTNEIQVYQELPTALHLSLPKDEENYTSIGGGRTPAWLNWRFFQKPDTQYKLLVAGSLSDMQGYAVLKEYHSADVHYGHIVDWQVPGYETATAKNLLISTLNEFAHSGCDRISCWALAKSSLFHLLPEFGLTPTGRKTNFGYFNLALENEAVLANNDSWNIYMGDSDVY